MMTDQEQARLKYLSDFIGGKGGSAAVWKETGINKQTLWQIHKMRNGASPKVITALADSYSDFDRSRASKYGVPEDDPDPSPTSPAGAAAIPADLMMELAVTKKENEGLIALTREKDSQIKNLQDTLAHARDIIAYQQMQFERQGGYLVDKSDAKGEVDALTPLVGKQQDGRHATGAEVEPMGFKQKSLREATNAREGSVFKRIYRNDNIWGELGAITRQSTAQAQA